MTFKWLVGNKFLCSTLIIETSRCVRFFDGLDLRESFRVTPPWMGGVLFVNVKIIRHFLYFFLRGFSFSRSTLVSAWIYAMYKYSQADQIATFYFSPKPFFSKIAQLEKNVSIHCIYPSLVTDNKNISINRHIFHYVRDQSDVERLIKRGADSRNVIVSGSPYISLYKRFLKDEAVVKKYDICIISQVVEELFQEDRSDYHHRVSRAFRKLLKTVNSLYKNYPFCGKVCVALRLSGDRSVSEREKSYFLNILNCVEVDFIENDPESYSSYRAMEQSSIGLTLNSTLAFDMRYIGIESIYAIDEDIEHRPPKEDIKYHFQNGSTDGLFRTLKKVSERSNRNINNASIDSKSDSIEVIREFLLR